MAVKEVKHVVLKSITVAGMTTICRNVVDTVKATTVVSTLVDIAPLKALVLELETAMKAIRGFSQTERLQAADKKRDVLLSAIATLMKAFCTRESDEQNDAKALLLVLNSFGIRDLRRASYSDETTLIRSLINRVNTSPNLELQNKFPIFSDWMSELEELNDEFDAVMHEKIDNMSQDYESCTEIRERVVPVYNGVIKRINAHALLETDPEFVTVVDAINNQIEAFHLV